MASEPVSSSVIWDNLWNLGDRHIHWDDGSRLIFNILRCQQVRQPKRTLEVGCGTGKISARLHKEGFDISLMDFSAQALRLSKQVWLASDYEDEPLRIMASMFGIPIKDNTYDLVWSAGVLEHWPRASQKLAVSEMVRVCRPGGKIVQIVPYSKSIPYRLAKWYKETRGTWPFGPEKPLSSMLPLLDLNQVESVSQRSVGFLDQFRWLATFPGGKLSAALVRALQKRFWGLNLMLPGWLLILTATKQ